MGPTFKVSFLKCHHTMVLRRKRWVHLPVKLSLGKALKDIRLKRLSLLEMRVPASLPTVEHRGLVFDKIYQCLRLSSHSGASRSSIFG